VEALESRLVPAGNLTVTVTGGLVEIVGDEADNGIEVSDATGGQIAFRPLNGTTINGQAAPLVVAVNGGIGTLNINTGAGNDTVVISSRSESEAIWPHPQAVTPLAISQGINVDAGSGDDVVLVRSVNVSGATTIIGGQGDDTIVAESLQVTGRLAVLGAAGTNSVLLRASAVTGNTLIAAGASRDAVGLVNSTFGGNTTLRLRAGGNRITAEGNAFNKFTLPKEGDGFNQLTQTVEFFNTFGGEFLRVSWNRTLPTAASTHFEYEGEDGPEHWGALTPAWLLTSVGRQQTPVAIDTDSAITMALPALNFSYADNSNTPFVHNGHTVQVNFPSPATNSVEVAGGTYNLLQFHFHASSEHTIDGESFPLEMHLVHADASGNLLVVTVFIKEGAANAAYDQLVANVPSQPSNTSKTIAGPFDPLDLLPTDRGYYAYSGSLTTPPGSEGVSFGLFKTAVELSAAQIEAIKTAIGVDNHRPIQPVNDRVIFASA